MNDKERDQTLKILSENQQHLSKNQAILIKNNNVFIPQIDQLFKANERQDQFDKNVSKQIGNVLELQQQVKELRNAVAKLQEASHKHEQNIQAEG